MSERRTGARPRREEYSEATRAALLEAAEEMFAQSGYGSASTESIARAARLTRGAFYHHFEDKKGLFDAVVVELSGRAMAAVQERAGRKRSPWARLLEGIEAFLDQCSEQHFAQIVILDAPSILGAARCREIERQFSGGLLWSAIGKLVESGEARVDDPDLLASMINAMVCRAAGEMRVSENPEALRASFTKTIKALLDGVRT